MPHPTVLEIDGVEIPPEKLGLAIERLRYDKGVEYLTSQADGTKHARGI